MLACISRYEYDQLDPIFIEICDRHRHNLLHTVRAYLHANRHRGFGDWNPDLDDEALFLYLYAKYYLAARHKPMTAILAREDYDRWVYRRKVPVYLCACYMHALRGRIALAA